MYTYTRVRVYYVRSLSYFLARDVFFYSTRGLFFCFSRYDDDDVDVLGSFSHVRARVSGSAEQKKAPRRERKGKKCESERAKATGIFADKGFLNLERGKKKEEVTVVKVRLCNCGARG